jgi:predicted nucleotidyltransferase
MATAHPRIQIPSGAIEEFSKKWDVEQLALFGSVLRDDFRPDSDVDVMVKFKSGKRPKLFGLIDMQLELEAIFGRPVDLIEQGTVENPFRRSSISRELAVLYAA